MVVFSRKYIWLFVLLSVFASLAAMLSAGILVRPLSFDEQNHYVPVLSYFYEALPQMPLTGYVFPAPPLGTYIQAIFFSLTGENVYTVRFLSFLSLLLFGCTVFAIRRKDEDKLFLTLFTLTLLTFPFLIIHAFTLRQHCLAILFIAASMLLRGEEHPPRAWRVYGESLLLCAAVMVHQIVLAYALSLFCVRCFFANGVTCSERARRSLPSLLPVVVVVFFLILWGGTTPPDYQTVAYGVYGESTAIFTFRLKQLVLLFLTLGVWFLPLYRVSRSSWGKYALAYVAAFFLVYLSGGYSPKNTFVQSIVGPVSNVSRTLAGDSQLLRVVFVSVPVGIGVSLFFQLLTEARKVLLFLIYTLIYFVFMCAVPSYFESYYLYYIIVSYLLLYPYMRAEHAKKCKVFFSICILAGLLYANITLFYRR